MRRRWVPALVLGGLWWWAVLRLVLHPDQAGLVEGAVAAGGWGLSLLPVHVASVPSVVPLGPLGSLTRRRTGPGGGGGDGGGSGGGGRRGRSAGLLTRAWRRRRSAGGSGRS
ncbi:hypothetical protein [Streptomyces sp. NPDC048142]|uniref:hypothetical protein n=1 Tax=Streptomyces sp. NPDC048142 TaxID=3365501 RepID=UPI00371AEF42